jgi:rhodanese-related sulfurtransferase
MYAQLASKLTSRELCHSPYPIILHVKSTVDKKKYDHYELFLRAENDKAVLFDPPESIRAVSFRELAPCWDGYGIIVSVTPIDTGRIFVAARKQFIIYTAIVSWIVLMVRWGRRRWLQLWVKMSTYQLSGFSMAQSVGLVITALVFGVIYHFGNDEGFLAHTDAVSAVQQAHAVNFIPKIDVDKVRRLLDTDMIFIDARLTGDFEAGHLEGAINVPVDSNDTKRHKALTNIAKDSRIVLYCQSSECEFAEIVANQLASDGFTNLSIFKGGWQEWQTKNN